MSKTFLLRTSNVVKIKTVLLLVSISTYEMDIEEYFELSVKLALDFQMSL